MILDEPTNDFDIPTLNVLEDFLDQFSGIVITVSHDRYFLDRVVDQIFAFEENGVIQRYMGGFSDYLEKKTTQKETVKEAKKKVIKKVSTVKMTLEEKLERWEYLSELNEKVMQSH